ncbi:unnamed protein product [Plutella xylostella]|uniref:(diamondback moth) hypothetical protein n=1 Tax=Plutella xylostella TaxID=51655 RepID=A0A8S4GD78_PLUXY|nr:unnamed protein product [Plutella xylostella]
MQGPSTSTSSLNWKRPPVRPFQPRTNTYQPVRAGGRPAAAYSRRGRATMPAATAARRAPPPATAAAAGASTAPDADIPAPSSAARPPHIVGNTALPEVITGTPRGAEAEAKGDLMVLQCEQIQCEKAEAMKMVAAAVNTQTAVNEGHNARLMAFIEAEKGR